MQQRRKGRKGRGDGVGRRNGPEPVGGSVRLAQVEAKLLEAGGEGFREEGHVVVVEAG